VAVAVHRRRLRPAAVLLLVEIADSSLAYDRDVKLPLYAAAGIPEAWIVDLATEALLVCRQPSPTGYREIRRRGAGRGRLSACAPGRGGPGGPPGRA
jgi:Uma2 family endonuclease